MKGLEVMGYGLEVRGRHPAGCFFLRYEKIKNSPEGLIKTEQKRSKTILEKNIEFVKKEACVRKGS